MKKIATLFGAVLLAGTAFTRVQARAADELTITSWGGAYSESQRKAFYEPFIAAGNKITEAEYNGEIAKIRAMVEAKRRDLGRGRRRYPDGTRGLCRRHLRDHRLGQARP